MVKNSVLLLLTGLICTVQLSYAQGNRYVITFVDKQGTPYSIDRPLEILSQAAVDRRQGQVTEEDFPPNPLYVKALEDVGARVYFRSRWMNNVLAEMEDSVRAQIEGLSFVSRVEQVAPGLKLGGKGGKAAKGYVMTGEQGNARQNTLLGIEEMHKSGFRGEGRAIAVFDGGFPAVDTLSAFAHIFGSGRMKMAYNFVDNSTDVYRHSSHGTEVLSIIGGRTTGTEAYEGVAYESDFMLFLTEDMDSEYRIEEYNWLYAAEMADSAGVDIIHASLGYFTFDDVRMDYDYEALDGKTTVISRAAQLAADRGILVVSSAGNEGSNPWKYITPPADAEGTLAIGALRASGSLTFFSSVGPASDGRVKPDLVALGAGVRVISTSGEIRGKSGTSFSAPIVTGLAAGLWQAYPDLDNLQLMDLLKKSADMASEPDYSYGYGKPSFQSAVSLKESKGLTLGRDFVIFPNPSLDGNVHIRAKDPNLYPEVTWRVIDATGRQVAGGQLFFSWETVEQTCSLTHLDHGLYVMDIITGDSVQRMKIIRD